MAEPMILADNLVKIYKTQDIEVLALQGLELTVEAGELMAIIGNSGSGKKPEMYLSIAYDELYGEVERMNDLPADDLEVLERSFTDEHQVQIEYRETGYGTKLLMAREVGPDPDFVTFLSIYKGYFVEFTLTPSSKVADQTLTEEQIRMCIDFLTDVDFIPVA